MKDIKVEMFALCQGAHNLDGHLTVVNTMDEFLAESFPTRISFGVAIKLYVTANVEGDKELSISILDKEPNCTDSSNRGHVIPEIKTSFHLDKMKKATHVNVALNLQNVLFSHPGYYDVHFEVDGKRLDDFAFEIIQK